MQLGSQRDLLDPPRSGPNAHHVDRAYQFFRYFVMGGRELDVRRLDVTAPGPVRDRIQELSALIDATATDLTPFAARGGRIIWLQGNDDPSVSPFENRRNYQAIVARMGNAAADRFIRYFELPGLAHGGGRFSPTWESLAALDAWVENSTPPDHAVVTDGTRSETRGRTRPLCAYPTWPKYRDGNVNDAASYACATE
jgi:feruloyl esterase